MNPVRFFNNLKIPQKLLLISLSFSLPIAVLLYLVVEGINDDIQFSKYEYYGDKYQRPLEKLLKGIPEHGILLKMHLIAPSEKLKDQLQQNEKAIDDALVELLRVDNELGTALQFTDEGLSKRKRSQFRAKTLQTQWQALRGTPRESMTAEVSDSKHRELKDHIRTMITHMGDTSNLILDPDLDSYYIMDVTLLALPQTQDRLSEIISYGINALRKDTLSSAERIQMAIYAAQLKEADLDRIELSLQTSLNEDRNFYGVNQMLQKNIPPALASYKGKTAAFLQVLQELATLPKPTITLDKFVDAGLSARDESFTLWNTVVDVEDSLLLNRLKTFQSKLVNHLVWTLLSLAISIALAYFITRSITRPMKLVVANLKAQASMDFSKHVDLHRTDELGEMAYGMNQVVNTLRAAIQKVISSSHSLSTQSHTLAMGSSDVSQAVANSPYLRDMVDKTRDAAKEVAKNAADLRKLAEQFRL